MSQVVASKGNCHCKSESYDQRGRHSLSRRAPSILPTGRRLRTLLATAITLLFCSVILIFGSIGDVPIRHNYPAWQNKTLGFEKVIIVSSGKSWRIDGLLDAAQFTDIEVVIPKQPKWSIKEVDAFRTPSANGSRNSIGPGQARCWLGHLNAWHEMLTNQWTTSLIIEDDADWDISIKQQLSTVAPMIRQVSNATDINGVWSPYGDTWDLLWLGHCGELKPGPDAISFIDRTLPDSSLYREVYGEYTYHPPHLRMVYSTKWPLCTYAYAITSSAALRMYQLTNGSMDQIITIKLQAWCRAGYLRCITVNPEFFHHHKKAGEVSSEIAVIEGWDDLAAPAKVDYTANIRYSARCNSKSERLVSCQSETV